MDRKTLLAFVLIALVLILTPWYMELVTPGYSEAPSDALYQAEETITNKRKKKVVFIKLINEVNHRGIIAHIFV